MKNLKKTIVPITFALLFALVSGNAHAIHLDNFFPDVMGELIAPTKPGFWKTQWENNSISFDLTPVSVTKQIGGGVGTAFNMNYRYEVNQAYIRDYQIRYDTYSTSLGFSKGISTIGLGTSLNGKIIFGRFYKKKMDAVKAKPYFLNRFPWSANQAITSLSPGDFVRVDMGLGVSASTGIANPLTQMISNASVGVSRGSSVLADIYRLKGNSVRVRFVATRTSAAASVSASAIGSQLFTNITGPVANWLRRFFYLNLFSASYGFTPSENLPSETYMVDYLFNLNNKDGAEAFNSVMEEFRKFKYVHALNFQLSDSTIANNLIVLVKKAEEVQSADIDKPTADRGVIRIFKGAVASNSRSLNFSSSVALLIDFWHESFTSSNSKSIIQGWDDKNKRVDLIFTANQITNNYNAFHDSKVKVDYTGTQVAYNAELNSVKDEPVPTDVSDFYMYRNISDTHLQSKQIKNEFKFLKFILPTVIIGEEWDKFANQEWYNTYLNVSIAIHKEAMQSLPKLSKDEVMKVIKTLSDRFPYVMYLKDGRQQEVYTDSVKYFAEGMYNYLNEDDIKVKIKILEKLKFNEVFNVYGPAFLISLIPEKDLDRMIKVKVNAGSGNQAAINFSYGDHDLSPTYSAIQAMNAIINERSFDLRILIDNSGKINTYKSAEYCSNCDNLN